MRVMRIALCQQKTLLFLLLLAARWEMWRGGGCSLWGIFLPSPHPWSRHSWRLLWLVKWDIYYTCKTTPCPSVLSQGNKNPRRRYRSLFRGYEERDFAGKLGTRVGGSAFNAAVCSRLLMWFSVVVLETEMLRWDGCWQASDFLRDSFIHLDMMYIWGSCWLWKGWRTTHGLICPVSLEI